MIASEARLAANRANALKSTGPRTAEGKERSRGNSYKHGLTGAGVVVATEDAEAIRRRSEGFQADFRPRTDSGRCLVGRAAMLSIRMERCVVQEAAAISERVRNAAGDFDEARMAEVAHLRASIGVEPAPHARRLRRMPEGVDRMVAAWAELRSDLGHGDRVRWSAEHEELAENLMGRRPEGFGTSRVRVLSRAIRGDFDLLRAEEGPAETSARRQWARARMVEVVDAEVAKLEAHRGTLDLGAIAADRALFDPSKGATLARRYEAAAERMMYRALREMKAVEAANGGRDAACRPAPGGEAAGRLGSFFPGAAADPGPLGPPVAPAPPAPSKAPEPARKPLAPASMTPPTPGFGDFGASSYVPISIGRAR